MQRFTRLAATALLACGLLAVLTPAASANPPEFEPETVESLLFDRDGSRLFIEIMAPPVSCKIQGVAAFEGCPNVLWECPFGVTEGATRRLSRNMTYNQLLAYSARDLMCRVRFVPDAGPDAAVIVAKPDGTECDTADPGVTGRLSTGSDGIQRCVVPVAVPADDAVIAFTGSESTVLAYVGSGLIAFGALTLGIRRRLE